MARFRIGQRVKKVHGMCAGSTGVVAEFDHSDERSLGVRTDQDGMGIDSWGYPKPFMAGDIMFGYPEEFEPIIDNHEPCEQDFKESLDLLCRRAEEDVSCPTNSP